MNEHGLARKVARWLRTQAPHVYYLKVHGGLMQRAGVADFWITAHGRSLHVELKRPGTPPRPSPAQRRQLELHAGAGGTSCVATSLEAVQAVVLDDDLTPHIADDTLALIHARR